MAVFVALAHFSKGDSILQSGICPICGKVPFNSEPACLFYFDPLHAFDSPADVLQLRFTNST
jgi:hypothetical protein